MLLCAAFVAICVFTAQTKADACGDVQQCVTEALKLGNKCLKDTKNAEPEAEATYCDKKWKLMDLKMIELELDQGKAVSKCVTKAKDDKAFLKCPKFSKPSKKFIRAKRDNFEDMETWDPEDPDWTGMSGEYMSYEYDPDMPESCLEAQMKEGDCWIMAEENGCDAISFCDICVQKSDFHTAHVDLELDMWRLERECPMEWEDFEEYEGPMIDRRKRFARRRR